jgi:hypothetical protein
MLFTMKKNVPLLLLACYFLPFCLFFAMTFVTSSRVVFCASLLVVSLGTLALFFAIKTWAFEERPLPVAEPRDKPQDIPKQIQLQHLFCALACDRAQHVPLSFRASSLEGERVKNLREVIASQEKELLLLRQKIEFSTSAIDELKTEIQKKNDEIESLKFELRVLVRLDEKILSAHILDNKVPDAAKKT